MKKAEKKIPATPERRYDKTVTVTAIRLAVRRHPHVDAEIVEIVCQGDTLETSGEEYGLWLKVRGGYAMKCFVAPTGD